MKASELMENAKANDMFYFLYEFILNQADLHYLDLKHPLLVELRNTRNQMLLDYFEGPERKMIDVRISGKIELLRVLNDEESDDDRAT